MLSTVTNVPNFPSEFHVNDPTGNLKVKPEKKNMICVCEGMSDENHKCITDLQLILLLSKFKDERIIGATFPRSPSLPDSGDPP